MPLKIGELARATGLSVRTLRHYDAVGLLSPSQRTEAEHRLYSQADFARLLHIRGLKALGLSLTDIRVILDDPEQPPQVILQRHIGFVEQQVREQVALLRRLRQLGDMQQVSAAELLEAIKMTEDIKQKVDRMMNVARTLGEREEGQFDAEQMAFLKERAETIGQQRTEDVQNVWPELMSAVLLEMKRGTDPTDPKAKALAARWKELVNEFTGGRQDIQGNLSTAYNRQMTPEMQAMWNYVAKAMN